MDILFNSASLKHQAEQLVETVKESDNSTEVIHQLNEAYLAGDLVKMSELSYKEAHMYAENSMKLVENRNNDWVKQLKLLMPAQSCFVAVECRHLTDKIGLIQQLRKAGFVVEPVENS